MTNEKILELYRGAVELLGAPISVVPLLIQLSKYMNEQNDIMLYAELRASISEELGVSLARITQVLKIMENHHLIEQSTEIKTVYHIQKFVLPYEELKNSNTAILTVKKSNSNDEIQIQIS